MASHQYKKQVQQAAEEFEQRKQRIKERINKYLRAENQEKAAELVDKLKAMHLEFQDQK